MRRDVERPPGLLARENAPPHRDLAQSKGPITDRCRAGRPLDQAEPRSGFGLDELPAATTAAWYQVVLPDRVRRAPPPPALIMEAGHTGAPPFSDTCEKADRG